MKPLTHCPYCQSKLIKKTIPEHLNNIKYEMCGSRCVVDYFQYYESSYDEPDISYIYYNTPNKKFFIYSYFNHYMFCQVSHIYGGPGMPILYLPLDRYPLNLNDLDAVQEKIATLCLFS